MGSQLLTGKLVHEMPEYTSYQAAKYRCTKPTASNYKWYGGRGIEFRFNSFIDFYNEVGDKPTSKHSLDRIDTNGHYESGNVRWSTQKVQVDNSRPSHNRVYVKYLGKKRLLGDIAKELGLKRGTLYARYHIHKMRGDKLFTKGDISRFDDTCKRGHPLSGDNLYIYPCGTRRACIVCAKMHSANRPPRNRTK